MEATPTWKRPRDDGTPPHIEDLGDALARLLCFLPSFDAIACTNKRFNDEVAGLKESWANAMYRDRVTVAPFARPSPRACANLIGLDIPVHLLADPPPRARCEVQLAAPEPEIPFEFVPTSPTWSLQHV